MHGAKGMVHSVTEKGRNTADGYQASTRPLAADAASFIEVLSDSGQKIKNMRSIDYFIR